MNILIAFHSIYGHTYTLAEYIGKGAETIQGADIKIRRIPEFLSPDIIKSMGAEARLEKFSHITVADTEDLLWADCIVLGAPTYFGKISSQMAVFMDSTSSLYINHSLKNKIGGAFVSSGCQNGGAEEALRTLHNFFFHHSMIPVGFDTDCPGFERNDKVFGTSAYGISCVAGEKFNEKQVSEEEKNFAQLYGRRLAEITEKIIK